MVLVLPGLYDSGPAHWQSLWQAQATTLHVERVVQQEWAAPDCADWVARLTHVMRESTHDIVLVAHHGSNGSSDPGFVAATGARWAPISSSKTSLQRWQASTRASCSKAIWRPAPGRAAWWPG